MSRVRITVETDDGMEIETTRESLIDYGDGHGQVLELLAECVRRTEQALADEEGSR